MLNEALVFVGNVIKNKIGSYTDWIAFSLLALIGAKMIYEGIRGHEQEEKKLSITVLLTLSIATSIDALQSIFIKDKWDKEKQSKTYYYLGEHISKPISNLPDQIAFIIEKSGYEPKEILKELIKLNKKRNQYIHSNPDYILPTEGEILKWHQLFCEIINKIKNRKTVSQKS